MVVVNTMMRRARITTPLRLAVLLGLGLNPLVVMYAAIGARPFLWLAFVVVALGALFAWYVTADIRFVMIAGLTYSVAALTGYGSLVWFLVSLVMVAAILARLGADGREVEGTTVGFAAPTVYAVALWSAFNLFLLDDPLRWITGSSDVAASGGVQRLSFDEVVSGTTDLVLHGAPIAVVVLPALLVAGLARRNGFALWLGVMLAVAILAPGAVAALGATDSPLVLSNALPVLLLSVIGATWLARSAMTNGVVVAGVLVVGLLASIPWTFSSMDDVARQGLERAFHDAVVTGEDQEGVRTVDGSVVGFDNELDMATFIREHVTTQGSILTDDASTYAVILLTGSPGTFFDRVDASDGPWGRAADAPAGQVDYLLLATDTAHDLLSARYPTAAAAADPDLPTVHANRRYTLVRVPAQASPPGPGRSHVMTDRTPPHGGDREHQSVDDEHDRLDRLDRLGGGSTAGGGRRAASISLTGPRPADHDRTDATRAPARRHPSADRTVPERPMADRTRSAPLILPPANLDEELASEAVRIRRQVAGARSGLSDHSDHSDLAGLSDPATSAPTRPVTSEEPVTPEAPVSQATELADVQRDHPGAAAAFLAVAAGGPDPSAARTVDDLDRRLDRHPDTDTDIDDDQTGEPGDVDDGVAVEQSVAEVAAEVVAAMKAVGAAHERHLEAIELEAARRCELLTAQAELDAELIRLHARREAHAIISAARLRSGAVSDAPATQAEAQADQLSEIGETFSRFAESIETTIGQGSAPSDRPHL